jgi:hypothetical protein
MLKYRRAKAINEIVPEIAFAGMTPYMSLDAGHSQMQASIHP